MTRIISGTVSVVHGDATFVFSGVALTDANCPADAQIVIDGSLYYVLSRTNSTTGELTRAFAGSTASGVPCEIDPLTPTTVTIANFARQVSDYNARLELLDAYGKGLFFTILGTTGQSDPGAGRLGRNATAWADTTELYIDVLDAGGFDATPLIDTWEASTVLVVRSLQTRAYASFSLSVPPVDQAGAWRLMENLTYLGGDGILSDGEDVAIEWNRLGNLTVASDATISSPAGLSAFVHRTDGFKVLVTDTGDGRSGVYTLDTSGSPAAWIGPAYISGPAGAAGPPGSTGATGATGADGTDPGVLLTWDTANTDSDPGAGKIRADNDALGSASFLYVSKANRAGDDISAFLATLDDSTSAYKGSVTVTRSGGNGQAIFRVTSLTDASGYVKVGVSTHSGTTGFLDSAAVSLQFSRTGDAGTGAVSSVNGESGAVVITTDDISDSGQTNKWATAAEKVKVGYLTVTSATDLDTIRSRVTELDAAVILKGGWDASTGTFPAAGAAQAGWSYVVTGAGTVDGVAFSANDRLLAVLDNASTTTYANNWLKLDYTDQVLTVAGRTGAITLSQADISGLTTADSPQLAGINVGHATDTTISRAAAGVLAVEGTVLLKGGRQSFYVPASAMYPKVTSGAEEGTYDSGTNDITIRCLNFDTSTQEYAQFEWVIPKAWDRGTVTFTPYWTNAAGATTQNVVWTLAGVAISDDDTLNAAMGTAQSSNDTWLAQNDLHVGPESSAITISGTPASGDMIVFQVSRDVSSDNMAGDAVLLGIMLFYTVTGANDS